METCGREQLEACTSSVLKVHEACRCTFLMTFIELPRTRMRTVVTTHLKGNNYHAVFLFVVVGESHVRTMRVYECCCLQHTRHQKTKRRQQHTDKHHIKRCREDTSVSEINSTLKQTEQEEH